MNYYIDWANIKKLAVLNETAETPSLQPFDKFLKTLEKNDSVYLETGCPFSKIFKMIEKGVKVYMINGNLLSEQRDSQREAQEPAATMLKTDEADALSLRDAVLKKQVTCKLVSDKYLKYRRLKPLQVMYELYTRTNTRAMNIASSFEREHVGDSKVEAQIEILNTHIKSIEEMKGKLAKELKKEFTSAVEKLGVKGIAHCLLGQILSIAPPPLFTSRSAYLCYAGLKHLEHDRYHHFLKSLYYLCTDSIVKQKDSPFRNLYVKFKNQRGMIQEESNDGVKWIEKIETPENKEYFAKYELKKRAFLEEHKNKRKFFVTYPSYVEKVVRNRVSTHIAKNVYDTFKDEL